MAASAERAQIKRPVLLIDVMDTICYDPFFKAMPVHFGMTFKELLHAKHPTAWVEFECGRISEDELCRIFFADGRPVDKQSLKAMLLSNYRFLDGMEPLLARLAQAGYEVHALSNYPVWWQMIEDKLRLSRYLRWTFISCSGPMQGVRKPSPAAYQRALQHLALAPQDVVFVDDRQVNVDGALDLGIQSLLFTGAQELEQQLQEKGLVF